MDEKGPQITQHIGVAVVTHPTGPWNRMDTPPIDLSPDGPDSIINCNPAVTKTTDGTFPMLYKRGHGENRVGPVVRTPVEAKTPLGRFIKSNRKLFAKEGNRFPTEDPFIWQQAGGYYAIFKDMNGALSPAGSPPIESANRHDCAPSNPCACLQNEHKAG